MYFRQPYDQEPVIVSLSKLSPASCVSLNYATFLLFPEIAITLFVIVTVVTGVSLVELNVVPLHDAVHDEEDHGGHQQDEGVEEAEGGGESLLGPLVEGGGGGAHHEREDSVQDGEKAVDLAQLLLGHQVGQQRPVDDVPHPALHPQHRRHEDHPLGGAGGEEEVVAALTEDGEDADDGRGEVKESLEERSETELKGGDEDQDLTVGFTCPITMESVQKAWKLVKSSSTQLNLSCNMRGST